MNKGKRWRHLGLFCVIPAILFGTKVLLAEPVNLTELGVILPSIAVNAENVSIDLKVNVGNDEPSATFVTAHTASGGVLQRNNLGYWIPWSGKLDELINNFSTRTGNELFIKILKEENMSNEMFPIRITVGYETSSRLKFGVFELIKGQN
tara:strand:- start:1093 stop:1542 length:450 start_codon:yes stop_codon:yes gene_type:complete